MLAFLLACQDYDLHEKGPEGLVPGPALRVSPDSLRFSELGFGEGENQEILLESIGDEAVQISSVSISGSGSFTVLNDVRGALEPLEQASLLVHFSPQAPENTGQLAIVSSDPASPRQLVDLYGDGLVPLLVADPSSVDFGIHSLYATELKTVRLENVGAADLSLRSVVGTGEGLSFVVPGPMNLAPGEATDVAVTLEAEQYQEVAGAIWADSTSVAGPLQVPILGVVAAVPIAICYTNPNPAIAGEETNWIGADSYDPTGDALTSYEWVMKERPLGSSASFQGQGPDRILIPDLPGHYAATLTVSTDKGMTASCDTDLEVSPGQDLWVQLHWSLPSDDLDLHLLRDDGVLYSDDDCWFANCRDHSLTWGLGGSDRDDPSLDLDDIEGTGPKTTEIPAPANGSYDVVVEDFWGRWNEAPNEATVEIYVRGVLTWTGTRTFIGDDTATPFARIEWPSGIVSDL